MSLVRLLCASLLCLPVFLPFDLGATQYGATCSILAVDTTTGEIGIIVASQSVAAGSMMPWAKAGVGAVATQSLPNISFGPLGLELLGKGVPPQMAVQKLVSTDTNAELRQFALIDTVGRSGAHTGRACPSWAGFLAGPGYCCIGNRLPDGEILAVIARQLEKNQGLLARRLLLALEGGAASGKRPIRFRSASLLIVREGGGYKGKSDRYVDLRVDDAPDALRNLRHLYDQYELERLLPAQLRLGQEADTRGDSIASEREFRRAEQILTAAMRRRPATIPLLLELARIELQNLHDPDLAIRYAQEAANRNARFVPSWRLLAMAQLEKGRFGKALEAVEKALSLEPANAGLKELRQTIRRRIKK